MEHPAFGVGGPGDGLRNEAVALELVRARVCFKHIEVRKQENATGPEGLIDPRSPRSARDR